MSDLEKYLQEVKSRCERATKGPWFGFEDHGVDIVKEGSSTLKIFETGCNCCTSNELSESNAAFIAQARTDVPRLLGIIKDLRHEMKMMRGAYDRQN